ncbi:MAG: ZIP family metal transporter [Leptospirillia bacterium]
MSPITEIILFTGAAGACIPLGGLLAAVERIHPRWLEQEFRHFMIAFGGGVMLAAVALVLVPEGMEHLSWSVYGVALVFLGGVLFFTIERMLGFRRREAPQFMAMLLDYMPESLAIGGIFATGSPSAPLLAILIGLQNIPEGFNGFRELCGITGHRRGRVLLMMAALVPLGPVLGVLGWAYFSLHVQLLGASMLVASGGILYLIFQDIAPQSRLKRHWAPPLGAVVGFALGLFGKSLLATSWFSSLH